MQDAPFLHHYVLIHTGASPEMTSSNSSQTLGLKVIIKEEEEEDDDIGESDHGKKWKEM